MKGELHQQELVVQTRFKHIINSFSGNDEFYFLLEQKSKLLDL